MGFSLRRMFRNPFGKKSLFGRATQLAGAILPLGGPLGALAGKAFSLLHRGRTAVDALQGRAAPILTAGRALGFVPSQAPSGVMPGGVRVSKLRRPTQTRATYRSRVARSTRRRSRRTTKRRRR